MERDEDRKEEFGYTAEGSGVIVGGLLPKDHPIYSVGTLILPGPPFRPRRDGEPEVPHEG